MVLGIVALFVCISITPSVAVDTLNITSMPISKGNTLYVGGTGEGNYTSIQEAMKNASNGDTIYVFSGLYGILTIYKSLHIIGENKYTTILNGTGRYDTVSIEANDVTLSGFTIQNGGTPETAKYGRGISLQQRTNVIVSDIILTKNYKGIFLWWSSNVLLDNITFTNKGGSIDFWDGRNCTITHCIFDNSGITHNGFPTSSNGLLYIQKNVFTNNSAIGLGYHCIDTHGNTTIESNLFENNSCPIKIHLSKGINIIKNNFINNTQDVKLSKECFFRVINIYRNYKQNWINNFWDDCNQNWRHSIRGIWTLDIGIPFIFRFRLVFISIPILKIPYKEYDYNPAKEPFKI